MGGSGGKMGGNTPPRPPPHIVENERPGAGQASKNVKLYHIKVGDFLSMTHFSPKLHIITSLTVL